MNIPFEYPRYTYNDYKNWKEDWELINGFPFQLLPSASQKHSKLQGELVYQSKKSLKQNDQNCNREVFLELDWKINEQTVVRPDIMVVCGQPTEDYLNFPPVLIIELLSPATIKNDRVIKFELYREQGVKFYLMVNVLKDTVEVYELIDNFYKQVEKNTFDIDKNCLMDFDFDDLWK